MEQTKGYLRLKGKIWALNNKEAKDFGSSRNLSFGLQTSKDNSLFLQLGEWKNTTLNVKIKGSDSTEVEEINEQEAIKRVQELFKDGDSIFVNLRTEADTYRKNIKYLINQIYIEKEAIDFDSADFEETNELTQTVIIIDKPSNRTVKVGITTYKGAMIEQELKLNDDDVNDYFNENVKVGDVMRLTIKVVRKPNYVDEGEETPTNTRKTLKGKTVGGGTSRRKIDGYDEYLEVVDVDIEKTEKQKYERSEIREALDLAESMNNKKESDSKEKTEKTEVPKDDDLPF